MKEYFVHPTSIVDDNVEIGEGTKVWHFSHIQTGARIGRNCSFGQNVNVSNNVKIGDGVKVQNNVSIYEGVELEDYVFCGPSCVFTNDLTPRAKYPKGHVGYKKTLIKEGASIGANATIICGHTVGRWALIGAGAVVTSDVLDHKTGKYYKWLIDKDGERVPAAPIMTFSKTDWELVQKHYNLSDTVILDGCWFYTSVGLFDQYILKYKKIKQNSKGAKRSIAKLFSNNLYGRFAQGTNSSFKHISMGTDKALTSETIFEQNKNAGFIAIGAAITSYARKFTIDAAQANYDVFCYADTDSIHCCCKPEEVKGIQIHESEYLHWKIETEWDEALFVRQKTYAEHIVVEDGEKVKEPYWNIKCAGLPDRCKKLFTISLKGVDNVPKDDIIQLKPNEKEMAFIKVKRNIDCFKQDLVIPGKLLPLQIPGGTVLAEVDFTLH